MKTHLPCRLCETASTTLEQPVITRKRPDTPLFREEHELKFYAGLPLIPTNLAHMILSDAELTALRQQHCAKLRQSLPRLGKPLYTYVRKLRHRNHRHRELAERGLERTIRRYQFNADQAHAWMPPYAKVVAPSAVLLGPNQWCLPGQPIGGPGPVSFDPVALHHDGMEIRRYYNYPTLLAETTGSPTPHSLHRGRKLDGVLQDWLISLYTSLCDWMPAEMSGRKAKKTHPFVHISRRRAVLALTVNIANHYLPDLRLTVAMLTKLLRPRPDHARTLKARQRHKIEADKEKMFQSIDKRSLRRA
jgi:hypothetical protein